MNWFLVIFCTPGTAFYICKNEYPLDGRCLPLKPLWKLGVTLSLYIFFFFLIILPWLVNLASLMYDVDQWLSGRVSALDSVVPGLIFSGGDHSIHCWWNLIRSKQLSCGSVCHVQVFAGFSGYGNSIYNDLSNHCKNWEWPEVVVSTEDLGSSIFLIVKHHWKGDIVPIVQYCQNINGNIY